MPPLKQALSTLAAAAILSAACCASAQVKQSATGSIPHLWVGGEYSSFHTDFNPGAGRLTGIGVYADYYFTHRLGIEATARFLVLNPPENQTQKDFLGGPTYTVYQHGRFYANALVQLGGVFIHYPYAPPAPSSLQYLGSYFAFVPGGNVEYRFANRWKIRGGYEFQFLPSAPGFPHNPSNGLTPSGFSIGFSRDIF